jgi:hypothetical protein
MIIQGENSCGKNVHGTYGQGCEVSIAGS